MVKKRAKIPETEPYPRKPTICSASNAQDSIFPTTHLQKLCSGVAAIDNRRELQHSSCHGRAKKSSHGSYNTATRNYKRPTKRRSLKLSFLALNPWHCHWSSNDTAVTWTREEKTWEDGQHTKQCMEGGAHVGSVWVTDGTLAGGVPTFPLSTLFIIYFIFKKLNYTSTLIS